MASFNWKGARFCTLHKFITSMSRQLVYLSVISLFAPFSCRYLAKNKLKHCQKTWRTVLLCQVWLFNFWLWLFTISSRFIFIHNFTLIFSENFFCRNEFFFVVFMLHFYSCMTSIQLLCRLCVQCHRCPAVHSSSNDSIC